MKRTLWLVVVVLLLVAVIWSFSSPALAQDPPRKLGVNGFDIDQGEQGMPRGSEVYHLADGTTEVYGPGHILNTSIADSEASVVSTPHGRAKASQVFNLPSGAEINVRGRETDIFAEDGALILKVVEAGTFQAPAYTGWLEQAANWSSNSLDYYSASWNVPSRPGSPSSSTVDFLFPAIEPTSASSIMQPVLEWNQAGSQSWTLRSWYGPVNGNYYASSPVNAKVRDSISGVMSYSRGTWTILSQDTSSRRSTSLRTNAVGTSGLAVFCALEAVNISASGDLPGNTTFRNLTFKKSGRNVPVTWTPYIDSSSGLSGLGVQISGGQVILQTGNP